MAAADARELKTECASQAEKIVERQILGTAERLLEELLRIHQTRLDGFMLPGIAQIGKARNDRGALERRGVAPQSVRKFRRHPPPPHPNQRMRQIQTFNRLSRTVSADCPAQDPPRR